MALDLKATVVILYELLEGKKVKDVEWKCVSDAVKSRLKEFPGSIRHAIHLALRLNELASWSECKGVYACLGEENA